MEEKIKHGYRYPIRSDVRARAFLLKHLGVINQDVLDSLSKEFGEVENFFIKFGYDQGQEDFHYYMTEPYERKVADKYDAYLKNIPCRDCGGNCSKPLPDDCGECDNCGVFHECNYCGNDMNGESGGTELHRMKIFFKSPDLFCKNV